MPVRQEKILIFGAGVIGSTYAVKLVKADTRLPCLPVPTV